MHDLNNMFEGTALQDAQILKQPLVTKPKVAETKTVVENKVAVELKPKSRKRKKPLFEVVTVADTDTRSKEYTTVRIHKNITNALKLLFGNKKSVIQIVETILVDYLNRNKDKLSEKFNQFNSLRN